MLAHTCKPSLGVRAFALLALMAPASFCLADNEFTLTLRDHRFSPAELKIPAHQRIRLDIHNEDRTPEEFESHALNREKLVPAGGKASVYVGPLEPGRYDFYGEFNEATAKGQLVVE